MAKRETAPTTANIVPMQYLPDVEPEYKKDRKKPKTKMRENMHHHIKNY